MSQSTNTTRNPWSWVPSGYFAEGIPYVMITWVAATMFKDLGHSDTEITFWVGNITLMWSLKPLWAAFLDMFKTKKWIVLVMEFGMVSLLALVGFCLPMSCYFLISIAVLWMMAFASATQDICVDGIYITSLNKKEQAKYVGIQGVFWNLGRIFSMAFIVYVASHFGEGERSSWTIAWCVAAAVMSALAGYHIFFLPRGSVVDRPKSIKEARVTFVDAWIDFFRKPQIWGMLAFVFLFRSGEGLLLGVGHLFLQADSELGGIGLSLAQKSIIDGTVSTVVSLAGGILGGMFISKYGLKKTLFTMAICLNLPNLTYVYLAFATQGGEPVTLWTVGSLVTIEKFFYSFGFIANMLYMMQQISPGKYHMTHYAFCTAIMNLVLWPTTAVSGFLADYLGYLTFFIIVMLATIPSFLAAWYAPFPRSEDELK
ncbi:MAG: MFS transporter [Puniceicoccaceae bacterium]|nr:MFS transporter [Puniceicoccaceae bacterium]